MVLPVIDMMNLRDGYMRKHFMDNIRCLVIFLLIPYHAAQAFNTWGGEYEDMGEEIDAACSCGSYYRMPLSFFQNMNPMRI